MNPSAPLLLIEDESAQRVLLAAYLRQASFRVVEAGNLAEGRTCARRDAPRLVILDLDLPEGDGLVFARDLIHAGVPLLILASRPGDRLRALQAGADDGLDKPYDPRELLVRVQNLDRRCGGPARGALALGAFHLDTPGRRVLDAEGREVDLTRGEYDLLVALVGARGRVLGRSDLSEVINPLGATVCSRSVDVLVSRLRRKLADDPRHPSLLLTVPGVGYRTRPG